MLRKFEAELLKKDWHTVGDGLEVKLCRCDELAKDELFVAQPIVARRTKRFCAAVKRGSKLV